MESSQWIGKRSPRPKKARMSRSKTKVLLVLFYDLKGIVHREFVPCSQMVNTSCTSFNMFKGCCAQEQA